MTENNGNKKHRYLDRHESDSWERDIRLASRRSVRKNKYRGGRRQQLEGYIKESYQNYR